MRKQVFVRMGCRDKDRMGSRLLATYWSVCVFQMEQRTERDKVLTCPMENFLSSVTFTDIYFGFTYFQTLFNINFLKFL
jgi:hypothetical protein